MYIFDLKKTHPRFVPSILYLFFYYVYAGLFIKLSIPCFKCIFVSDLTVRARLFVLILAQHNRFRIKCMLFRLMACNAVSIMQNSYLTVRLCLD